MATNIPTFQHRHYKAIAAWIAGEPAFDADAIERFADMLARDNVRFDRPRFVAAAKGAPINRKDDAR